MPKACSTGVYGIMTDCWLPLADTRPTFDDVVARLRAIAQEVGAAPVARCACSPPWAWSYA